MVSSLHSWTDAIIVIQNLIPHTIKPMLINFFVSNFIITQAM